MQIQCGGRRRWRVSCRSWITVLSWPLIHTFRSLPGRVGSRVVSRTARRVEMLRSVTVRRWGFWRSSGRLVLSVGEDMCMLSVGWWMVFW